MIPYQFDSTFSKCKLSVFEENCSPCTCGGKNCLKTEHIYPNDGVASWSKSIWGSALCVLYGAFRALFGICSVVHRFTLRVDLCVNSCHHHLEACLVNEENDQAGWRALSGLNRVWLWNKLNQFSWTLLKKDELSIVNHMDTFMNMVMGHNKNC